jgi:hypothetical protein
MGGFTFEYYTKLSHFSIGADVDVILGFGPGRAQEPRSTRPRLTARESEKARNLERVGVSETDDASEATGNTLKTSRAARSASQLRASERRHEEDRHDNATSGCPGEPGRR